LRGVEIIQQLSPESLEQFLTSRVAEIAPEFARMAIEFSFGDIYARETIDLETREIAAIAALASLGHAGPQLRMHVTAALELGMTKGAIVEILMQSAIYGGFPAALNALAQCHDLLADDDCVSGSCA
jgi:4-carboxymuconolactone decarboxylase